ncbi:hypothetical protein FPQ18DRAFT_392674 [Pyronema domesticum]|uniref:BED-type domain-containing protein n=1 Tax=Pyronema omphalodes (strain CBS 100304) TaxID=1076935 RepID=U4LHU3_PYROM|nr:hypothetical protein FPQ18DRAFT_392674 [Pyronema domesticum]CCX31694.1 Protein of unknown function [Pyronema omphalodes CBS 100304]
MQNDLSYEYYAQCYEHDASESPTSSEPTLDPQLTGLYGVQDLLGAESPTRRFVKPLSSWIWDHGNRLTIDGAERFECNAVFRRSGVQNIERHLRNAHTINRPPMEVKAPRAAKNSRPSASVKEYLALAESFKEEANHANEENMRLRAQIDVLIEENTRLMKENATYTERLSSYGFMIGNAAYDPALDCPSIKKRKKCII